MKPAAKVQRRRVVLGPRLIKTDFGLTSKVKLD
jgi:hypothetical protein